MVTTNHDYSPHSQSIFLCYSKIDREVVREIYAKLKQNEFMPWLDEESLEPGQNWQSEIRECMRRAARVIVCLSKNSLACNGFVQREIKIALEVADEKPQSTVFIIPLRLENCELPEGLKHLHRVDYFDRNQFEKLLKSLPGHIESVIPDEENGNSSEAPLLSNTANYMQQRVQEEGVPKVGEDSSIKEALAQPRLLESQDRGTSEAQPNNRDRSLQDTGAEVGRETIGQAGISVSKVIEALAVMVMLLGGLVFLWDHLPALIAQIREYLEKHKHPPNPGLWPAHLLQALVTLGFMVAFYILFATEERRLRDKHARSVVLDRFVRFRGSWLLVWGAWSTAYIWLVIRTALLSSYPLDLITDAVHITCGFAIWRCFLVLDLDVENANTRGDLRKRTVVAAGFGILWFVLAVFDTVREWGHIGLVCMGLYTGLALTSLAGRLGSHCIGMQRWKLLSLNLYGMVQILYVLVDLLPPPWQVAIFLMFLALKIVFGFAGVDMLKSDGLTRYLDTKAPCDKTQSLGPRGWQLRW